VPGARRADDFDWFTTVFGHALAPHLEPLAAAASDEIPALDYRALRGVIEAVGDPILVSDASGATSLMNEAATRLFVRDRADEAFRHARANGVQMSSFISGIFGSPERPDGNERRRVGALLLTDPNTGAALPMEAVAGTILTGSGELTAIVTILHDRREALDNVHLYEQLKDASDELELKIQAATADIAEQNELLRRQALELEQASAMKSQFLANMSHEFRTPLNAILGYTSMLLQGIAGPLDPAPRRHLARVESNGRHLLAIINEILDISRIEAGRMPLQLTSFRLQDLLIEVRGELEPIIARTVVPVVLDTDSDLPLVRSDRHKVKQIILNLVSNALKFTHAGAVTLRARRSETEAAVAIAVADTGIGIPAADQERIFDDFLQLDNSPTRPYGGTGLGLSICRRLAQMIGARLTVQSRVGHGSTFTVTLPIQGRK
jgi:signal transduction histidine kinase